MLTNRKPPCSQCNVSSVSVFSLQVRLLAEDTTSAWNPRGQGCNLIRPGVVRGWVSTPDPGASTLKLKLLQILTNFLSLGTEGLQSSLFFFLSQQIHNPNSNKIIFKLLTNYRLGGAMQPTWGGYRHTNHLHNRLYQLLHR